MGCRCECGRKRNYKSFQSLKNEKACPGGTLSMFEAVGQADYSAIASFSITTFKCVVTSLCSFTGTANSPSVFNGSCN